MRLNAYRFFATFTAVALLAMSVCPALPAAAQQEPGSKYNEILQRALEEFDLGNWQEARALFRKAHQMNPNARTLRGMGMAAFEMRSYLAALEDLEASLREQRKPLTDEQREQVKKLIERTKTFLGRYHIEAEPPEVTLQVDGETKDLGAEKTLVLELGEHEIVAMASGYQEQRQTVTVEGGEDKMLSFMLEPVAEAAPVGPVPNPAPAAEQPAPAAQQPAEQPKQPAQPAQAGGQQKWDWAEEKESGPVWAWVALGASALSAGVAGIFWAQGEQKYSNLENDCEEWCDDSTRSKAAKEIEDSDRLTNIFLITSGVLAGGAVILFIVESVGGSSKPEKKAALELELGAGSAGLKGSF
jgi:hypothetical protein